MPSELRAALPTSVEVAIIGAGFGGIALGYALSKAGIGPFAILEAGDALGGTWRDNVYPGCTCDVPSHFYSYSFARNPTWGRVFSRQPEILAYLDRCVEQFGLGPHIHCGTRVAEMRFDADEAVWNLRTAEGQRVRARFVVAATGTLQTPSMPKIPGLDGFEGKVLHSARWDPAYDFHGKRVAVVGTGASAIQIVPALQPLVQKLISLQRTPTWVLPKPDGVYSEQDKERFARSAWRMGWHRNQLYWRQELLGTAFMHMPSLLRPLAAMGRRNIERAIQGPALRRRLTPQYTVGCKRLLLSNDYYPALARSNVCVTAGLAEVRGNRVVTTDGDEHTVDAIVFATGFDVLAPLVGMPVYGLGGALLSDVWRDTPRALYGLAVSGFPNFFMTAGPNGGAGHTSLVFMIEAQANYISRVIARARRRRLRWVNVRRETQERYNAWLDKHLRRTVWASGCRSWFVNAEGHNYALWPTFTFSYWLRLRALRRGDWEEVL